MSSPFGNPLLQVSPYASDCGELIGRDPREVAPHEWAGRSLLIGLKAIRAKCLDCATDAKEVRKCVQTDCPLWPLRMGSVPKGFNVARTGTVSCGAAPPRTVTPDGDKADEIGACGPKNDAEGAI